MDRKNELITDRLGGILRELRAERDMTREWVSEHSDTGLRHLAAIELGEKNPSVDTLYRLIRCIGASADRVFYPEIVATDAQTSNIVRLLATCSPKQRQLIMAFIRMLKDQEDSFYQ